MIRLLLAAATLAVASHAITESADTTSAWKALERADGEALEYLVIRPAGDESTPRPVVLAFPPGMQTRAMVEASTELYWQAVAEAGWIAVCPQAPSDGLFYAGGAPALAALLDEIEATLPVEGRVHIAGPSNGGRSSFRAGFDHAARIASITVLPGFPEDADMPRVDTLANIPVAMFVGGADTLWLERMNAARAAFEAADVDVHTFRVFDDEGHTPASLTGAIVAEQLAAFAEHERMHTESHAAIDAVLDDFHDAASAADGERYFAHFTADGVFLGTDATERWSVDEFRAYAAPFFSEGKGWTYTSTERHVSLSADRRTAWFDERLHNDKYGETRGSGALVLRGERWLIAQYNLTIPVPNDLAGDLIERIAEHLADDAK